MKTAKISVIIPIYNTAQYLRQCLDSVIHQSLKDIEIICVDDGSTDNSLQILQEYAKKDKRIIILQQENQGAGVARNYGMKVATAEYLSFLDSDDFLFVIPTNTILLVIDTYMIFSRYKISYFLNNNLFLPEI